MSLAPLDGMGVLVVGASGGIGAACAVACAEAGAAEVVLAGRDATRLRPVEERVRRAGATVTTVEADVTTSTGCRQVVGVPERLDAVVCAVGANRPQRLLDVDPDTFEMLLSANLRAPFFLAQAAAARMVDEGGGAIVLLSSQMGHVGAPLRTAYCATKHGVEGMTKAMAVELAPMGIRVVSVSPTFVRTEMTATQLDDERVGPELLAQLPIGRFGTVEEVAQGVVFVASPAASLMTGTSLVLDGGWTAR